MSAPEVTRRVIHVPPGAGQSVWAFSGDRYTLKVGAEETGGMIGVMEGEIPPGSGPPLHVHQYEDEAFYLVEGRLQVFDEDREFTAEPGSFIYLPRGSAHRFKNISDTPARMLMLFVPSGFENFFLEVGVEVVPGQPAPSPSQFEADVERSMRIASEKYGIE
ncbi:Cupin domain-containing protein [Saccharopolyspora shandongensis]|uniref:Cupin domain-containing protein n=1 Tax=Saccharopolyspora shandongensis TaxID=418495 RepID=A0A1H3SIP7_9PSEU|nr:cupin domain-containing protein [Saccharopolyspora shandongensis]SDZ37455.1 Cupin domain-containing protein [Saccharopolyspora shandongensis]